METTMSSSSSPWACVDEQPSFSSKACWTCRKKRVKCDGCLPTCFKCRLTGRECLGYSQNKPLVWAGGIASRGKMMGRSFGNQGTPSSAELQLSSSVPPVITVISDPVLQDLTPQLRQYLFYYIHRCSVECTLYEDDSPNRFKQFLVLIPSNPVLVHSLVAVAASHQAATCIPRLSSQSTIHGKSDSDGDNQGSSGRCDKSLLTQHSDALTHSTLGMGALREGLANTDCSDALVAAVFLLIWVDIMDCGKTNWKFHLEGLKVLISLRRSLGELLDMAADSNLTFQKWFEETFAVLSIFGSTFDPSMLQLLDVLPWTELDGILGGAEAHSWTGCPADLMLILHTFSILSSRTARPPAQYISQSFIRLRNFDCAHWASKGPQPSSAYSRRSLAEAWKGSIEIYGRRVLGGLFPDFQEVPSNLVETTLFHLGQIDRHDTHFKGTVWPIFVVGAEALTAQQRQAVLNKFDQLIEYLRSSNLYIARAQLERIWARSSPYPPGGSWVHDIWERKEGLLLL
ncbi:fungal-specific transcription factor domain-containing protein [Xylariaceae sp. FL0662B]|nr:fungal-specific transcription factor domain-containing protein [Xylariaceae sp. FL0662B]